MTQRTEIESLGDAMRLSKGQSGRGLICWGEADGWCGETHADLPDVLRCRTFTHVFDRQTYANDSSPITALTVPGVRVDGIERFLDEREASGVEVAENV